MGAWRSPELPPNLHGSAVIGFLFDILCVCVFCFFGFFFFENLKESGVYFILGGEISGGYKLFLSLHLASANPTCIR